MREVVAPVHHTKLELPYERRLSLRREYLTIGDNTRL
jgi:hypothetical protein